MMTPKERVANALQSRKPDKLPIMVANSNTFICQYYGMSVQDFLRDPNSCAEGNIRFTQEFGIDYNLCVNGYILYGCGPELDVGWKFVGDNFPGFVEGPLKTENDLDKIRVPAEPSGYFKHYLEVATRVNRALGERYHLSVSILGPFAVACFLRGIEEALIDTVANREFFGRYMERCTDLSTYFGQHIISTGIQNPVLNEIFLTPQMIRPDTYHEMIAPHDQEVQRRLAPTKVPNSLAVFMGHPKDRESQHGGAMLYDAFFGISESIEPIREAIKYRMEGMPFPAAISGRALNEWDAQQIISHLKKVLNFLVKDQGLYPSITLVSVQADSPGNAQDIARKIQKVREFRDQYIL
jgi:uroporphyrinogen-III decarboxylase